MQNLQQFYSDQAQRGGKKGENSFPLQYQFMANLCAHKKIQVDLFENKKFIKREEKLDGNLNENDDHLLRKLKIQMMQNATILMMQIQLIQPNQDILISFKNLDLIYFYKLSELNSKYENIIFYTEWDQIMVKNQLNLPSITQLNLIEKNKLNGLIQQIHIIYDDIEQKIMQEKDKLFSLLQLDSFQIEMFFQEHLALLNQYKDENYIPEIEHQQQTQIVFAKQCEFFNEQISIDSEKHINKQNLTHTELNIINNIQNPEFKQKQFQIKIFYIENKLDPNNQQTPNTLSQVLEGFLLQEFQLNYIFEEAQSQYKGNFTQMYFPQEDPNQKNVLKVQLPQIEISVIKKLYILKDVILYIKEQQNLLKNSYFKGKLSVLLMIRFCDVLGYRPVFILQKKDKKLIDIEENRKYCNTIIRNFIQQLFFSKKYLQKVEPIEDICGEFLRNLSQKKFEQFPDYVQVLSKLEKLIILIKQLYSVNI